MNYAQRIKNIREDLDKTQAEIANAINLDQSKYSKVEIQKRKLVAEEIIELCRYYNLSADYILGLTDEPKPLK